MKINLKNTLLSVLLLASLVGCGSDGGGGVANPFNINGGASNGLASNVSTAAALSNAIRNNNFKESSTAGMYPFPKASASSSDSNCEKKWGIFTVCTYSSSSSSSYYSSSIGVRELRDNGEIVRDVYHWQYGNLSFSEDAYMGNNLGEIANTLATAVDNAKNNGNLYKVFGNTYYRYVENMSCANYDYTCLNVKNSSTNVWMVLINGKRHIIDLNSSLIKQPVAREY